MSDSVAYFVDFLFPGLLFGDTSTKRIADPTAVEIPEHCAGYTVYERAVAMQDGEELLGKPKNHRPSVYFGTEMNADDVKRKFGEKSIAAQNAVGNGWTRFVELANGQLWNIPTDAIVRSR